MASSTSTACSVISSCSFDGRQPGGGEHLGDVVHPVRLGQLHRRDVDADVRRLVAELAPPARGLRARLLQHPPAERDDRAALLGQLDEPAGPDAAPRRGAASGPAPRRRAAAVDSSRPAAGTRSRNSPRPMPPRSPESSDEPGGLARVATVVELDPATAAQRLGPRTARRRPRGSARRRRCWPWPACATPMLAVTLTGRPSMTNGTDSASRRRSASRTGSPGTAGSAIEHEELVGADAGEQVRCRTPVAAGRRRPAAAGRQRPSRARRAGR